MLDPYAALKISGLTLDMNYADFGCGDIGHFVFPASEVVGPAGRVYAVDILKGAIAGIESRIRLEGVANVLPIWGDIERPGGVNIETGTVHVVSLVNIVGIIRKSPSVLEEVKRVLRPGGRLLLIGWKEDAAVLGIPESRRITPVQMRGLVEAAGFTLLRDFDAGVHHWGLLFRIG